MLKVLKNKRLILVSLIIAASLVLLAPNFVFAQASPTTPAPTTPAPTTPAPTTPAPGSSPSSTANQGTGDAGIGTKLLNAAISVMVTIITFVINALTQLAGKLVILLMEIVVWLSMYNRFIDNPYVNEGWVILRDLVNMFFILGLLFIAFVTVLKIEKYQWNKLLARLLVMAILVNFSKTIAGVIIDFFQVLMITFVNAYKDITAGNIFKGLAMTDWFQININQSEEIAWQAGVAAVVASLLALAFTVVTLIVMLIFCVILAFRIVALWALVVFSPLAFFAWVFQGQGGTVGSLANKWWSQFFNYCMIGPFLAFFLWLSILTMAKLNLDQMVPSDQYDKTKRNSQSATIGTAGTMDNVITIMMGIIMLVAGLKFSQEFAVAGAGMAGRSADWMKNKAQGTLERGAKRAALGVAAPALLAGRAAKPFIAGAREGISERLQRGIPIGQQRYGRATRLLTKEGRKQAAEEYQALAKKPFVGGAERRETQKKHAQEYREKRRDINWDNASEIEKTIDKEVIGEGNRDEKTGRIKDPAKVNKDPRAVESFYSGLADKGKLDYSHIQDMEDMGFFDGKSKMEKQMFLEDMENRVEKETGRKKAFSSLVYNEDTNDYEDVGELEEKAQGSMVNARNNAGAEVDLSQVDMGKVTKKRDDGTYGLDKTSSAFNNLNNDQQEALQNLEAGGTQYQSDFYNVARLSDVRDKKKKEVSKKMATSNKEQFNKASKQSDLGDPSVNSPYTGVELDGAVKQLPRVGGLDQAGRDNYKVKIDMRFADDDERLKIIEANKGSFNKKMHRKIDPNTGQEEKMEDWKNRVKGYYSNMDAETAAMGEDQLMQYQNFYQESTAKFDDFGRKQEEGVQNTAISRKLRQVRSKKGAGAVIEQEVTAAVPDRKKGAAPNIAKSIDVEAFDMLDATENQQKPQRIKVIAERIADKTALDDDEAEKVAKVLIENETKIRTREKSTNSLKKSASVKIKNIADSAQQQFKTGDKNTGRMQFKIDALVKNIETEIDEGGLSSNSLAPDLVKKELEDLKTALATAPDEKSFQSAFAKFKSAMSKLGYKVEKKKGSET